MDVAGGVGTTATTVVCFGQAFLVLVCRGAYIIDLLAAVIMGYFFWILGMWLSYWTDVKILGLSFQERFPHF